MMKFRRDKRVGLDDEFYFGLNGDYLQAFDGNIPNFVPDDLLEACQNGNTDQLEVLMPKNTAPSSRVLDIVDVLLEVAVKHCQPEVVRYLLTFEPDYYISPDLVYRSIPSIELYSVFFEAHPSILEYEWEHLGGAVIVACTCNLVETLTFLLERGADPGRDPEHFDECDWSGGVPLDLAASRGSLHALRALVLHGAKIEDTEALQRAAMCGQLEVLDTLLGAGANIDQMLRAEMQDHYGRPPFGTALHDAIKYEQPQSVEFLLRRGASTMIRDSEGLSPLQRAQESRNQSIQELFRDYVQ